MRNIISIKGEYKYIGFVQSMAKTLGKENEIIIDVSNVNLTKGTLNLFAKTVVKTWLNMGKRNLKHYLYQR